MLPHGYSSFSVTLTSPNVQGSASISCAVSAFSIIIEACAITDRRCFSASLTSILYAPGDSFTSSLLYSAINIRHALIAIFFLPSLRCIPSRNNRIITVFLERSSSVAIFLSCSFKSGGIRRLNDTDNLSPLMLTLGTILAFFGPRVNYFFSEKAKNNHYTAVKTNIFPKTLTSVATCGYNGVKRI